MNNIVFYLFIVGIISLAVGSFLNVVIIRLPRILGKKYLNLKYLLFPRSHCPLCKHQIKIIENMPILSFIFLKGRCKYCNGEISIQYPVIELLTIILSIIVAYKFGFGFKNLVALILTWVLIVQATIDFKHYIIPDEITLPILWSGLFANCFNLFQDPSNAIIGAIAGYLILWLVYWIFKLITKKEGLGYGDFKLLAMLGAWLGWQQLPVIIILSSLLGSIIGIYLIIFKNKKFKSAIPFGPYLAIAGWIALVWGSDINRWYLQYIGMQ